MSRFAVFPTPPTGLTTYQIARVLSGRSVEAKTITDEFNRGYQPALYVDGAFLTSWDLLHDEEIRARAIAEQAIDTVRGSAMTFLKEQSRVEVPLRWTLDAVGCLAHVYWDRELANKLDDNPAIAVVCAVPIEDGIWVGLMYSLDVNEQKLLLGYTDPVEAKSKAETLLQQILKRVVPAHAAHAA